MPPSRNLLRPDSNRLGGRPRARAACWWDSASVPAARVPPAGHPQVTTEYDAAREAHRYTHGSTAK